jgi:hypothetical protein
MVPTTGRTTRLPTSSGETTMRKFMAAVIAAVAAAMSLTAASAANAGYWAWNGYTYIYIDACYVWNGYTSVYFCY